jgi:hypothetical protein
MVQAKMPQRPPREVNAEVDFANAVPRGHVDRLTRDTKLQRPKGRETQRLSSQFNQRQPAFHEPPAGMSHQSYRGQPRGARLADV